MSAAAAGLEGKRGRLPLLTLVLAVTAALPSCDPPAPGAADTPPSSGEDVQGRPQAISLLGEPLFAVADTTGAIEAADRALEADPGNVDLVIEAGRVRRNFMQYREAMELYGRAIELAPGDWRPYRFRGHRYISVREFPRAAADLEKARELAPLNWDVSYHLGLAYFLQGRFAEAADEYRRCLALADDPDARVLVASGALGAGFRSCVENGTDPDSRVAMTDWAYRAARRAGRGEEAERLIAAIDPGLAVEDNVAYLQDILFYGGHLSEEEVLEGREGGIRLETVGFGIANWYLAEGDTARAVSLLRRVAADPHWPGFGRIAAEADLARMDVR